ncbi:hypothetical protein Tco_1292293 [Tanacetum coccineum]
MVVPLSFTVNNYHDGLFTVNPLEYVHLKSWVIDDVSFDDYGETNVPLDDVAHVVEQFEHENEDDHNKLLTFCGKNVNEGKCAGLEGKKPKKVNEDECETSKQGSKKGDDRKAVNETLARLLRKDEIKRRKLRKREGKAVCIVDHEGGLVDHYSKLWQYRQAILDTNPGSTCVLENEVNHEDGKLHFSRDDLNLGDGGGISIISDEHKGLLQAVVDWLPNAEHRQCVRQIYANFKKRWSGLQFKRLFWGAAETLMEAYFEMDRYRAAFENGISESFNSRIIVARGKPIITMLEDIRVYIMQRMFCMNKLAFDNKDSITPSVRRQMEYNKRI